MAKTVNDSRDIAVTVQIGDVAVSWMAEGVSWNPSIARDMQDRAMSMLHDAIIEAMSNGLLQVAGEVYFDDGSNEAEEEGDDA